MSPSNRIELNYLDDFNNDLMGEFQCEYSLKKIKEFAIKKTLRDVNGSVKLAAEVLEISPGMVKIILTRDNI